MTDLIKIARTIRRLALAQPLSNIETKEDLHAAASILFKLAGGDPDAALRVPPEPSESLAAEGSVSATKGPLPTFIDETDYTIPDLES